MECPRVSIIMGIYNCEKILPAAIASVKNQTMQDWELIMCDDGSKDNTYAVALKFAAEDQRITVLQNPQNMRLAYSLNQCLKVARGKYIARMDADDQCLPNRFETQVLFLDQHPEFAVVGSAMTVCDGEVRLYDRFYPEYPMKQEAWSSVPFAHPTVMMRKEAYDALDGYSVSPEIMRAEDLDLWFRFRLAGFDGYNLQESLYLYQESLTDYKKRSFKAAVQTSKVVYKYYKRLHVPFKYWIIGIKPIVAALLPAKVNAFYHKRKVYI